VRCERAQGSPRTVVSNTEVHFFTALRSSVLLNSDVQILKSSGILSRPKLKKNSRLPDAEDGGLMLLQDVGNYLSVDTASLVKRLNLKDGPCERPQMSHSVKSFVLLS
jgi:hypothetical protein